MLLSMTAGDEGERVSRARAEEDEDRLTTDRGKLGGGNREGVGDIWVRMGADGGLVEACRGLLRLVEACRRLWGLK
jgi:hypothetical protein